MDEATAPATRHTLIVKLRDLADAGAWREFVSLYQPLVYRLARRSHNPILREAALGNDSPPIAWLGQRAIEFTYH